MYKRKSQYITRMKSSMLHPCIKCLCAFLPSCIATNSTSQMSLHQLGFALLTWWASSLGSPHPIPPLPSPCPNPTEPDFLLALSLEFHVPSWLLRTCRKQERNEWNHLKTNHSRFWPQPKLSHSYKEAGRGQPSSAKSCRENRHNWMEEKKIQAVLNLWPQLGAKFPLQRKAAVKLGPILLPFLLRLLRKSLQLLSELHSR